jgi:hypothetical protein
MTARRIGLVGTVLASLVFAGCGGSDEDKTAPFVGTWTIAAGSQLMVTCPMPLPTFNQQLAGAEQTLAKGTDSDLVMTPLAGCMVKLDVAGKVGTIRPNQTCNLTVMNLPVAGTISSGSFTLTDTGASFTYAGTGALGAITCMFTASGTSTKGAAATDGGAVGAGG